MDHKTREQLLAREQAALYLKQRAEELLQYATKELQQVRAAMPEHQPVEVMTGAKGGT